MDSTFLEAEERLLPNSYSYREKTSSIRSEFDYRRKDISSLFYINILLKMLHDNKYYECINY